MRKSTTLFWLLLFFILPYACNLSTNQTADNSGVSTTEEANPVGSEKIKSPTVKTKPEAPPAYGIDISIFQGNEIDLLTKQKDNLTFVICKATEGITYTDPDFAKNWKMIPERGFIRGAYHFFHSQDDPAQQAEHFAKAISGLKKTDLPPIVDFEGGGIDKSQSVEAVQNSLLALLGQLKATLQRQPMIYTDISSGDKYLNLPEFEQYPLWVADYNNKPAPDVPVAWANTPWKFWQKSSSFQLDRRKNDFDVFNGSEAELLDFIEGTNQ